jgi:hypothetical protein
MTQAGSIISIIAGIFGVLAAAITLLVGGVAASADVIGFGWGGLIASFLVIIFGAVALSKPKNAGIGLIICSIGGFFGGGSFVAVCLMLSLIGGILCLVGARSTQPVLLTVDNSSSLSGNKSPTSKRASIIIVAFGVILLLLMIISNQGKQDEGGSGSALRTQVERGKETASQTPVDGSNEKVPRNVAALIGATPTPVQPTGELADIFSLMSEYTNLQRENKFKELKGNVVEWRLTVYEVSRHGDGYKIQTGGIGEVGTFVHLKARDDTDKKRIEAMKTGDKISIRGVIKDTFIRSFVLDPALLL